MKTDLYEKQDRKVMCYSSEYKSIKDFTKVDNLLYKLESFTKKRIERVYSIFYQDDEIFNIYNEEFLFDLLFKKYGYGYDDIIYFSILDDKFLKLFDFKDKDTNDMVYMIFVKYNKEDLTKSDIKRLIKQKEDILSIIVNSEQIYYIPEEKEDFIKFSDPNTLMEMHLNSKIQQISKVKDKAYLFLPTLCLCIDSTLPYKYFNSEILERLNKIKNNLDFKYPQSLVFKNSSNKSEPYYFYHNVYIYDGYVISSRFGRENTFLTKKEIDMFASLFPGVLVYDSEEMKAYYYNYSESTKNLIKEAYNSIKKKFIKMRENGINDTEKRMNLSLEKYYNYEIEFIDKKKE